MMNPASQGPAGAGISSPPCASTGRVIAKCAHVKESKMWDRIMALENRNMAIFAWEGLTKQ